MERFDLLIAGGGAAGMAAAQAAAGKGRRVLLAEREPVLGGILNQCVHRGFGRSFYGEDLSGVEYARRFIREMDPTTVTLWTGTEVLELRSDRTALLSRRTGLQRVGFDSCILACGSRERSLDALRISGTRPAGIFTAGTAQKLMNIGHYGIGRTIVILGSGDVGQIMARQFVQSGRNVAALAEQSAVLGGLARNRRECVEAYRIPVLLHTTVEEVMGEGRVRGVVLRDLKTDRSWVQSCDTLIVAAGLVPDRILADRLTGGGPLPGWLSLCGNCDYIHDIVDAVTREGLALGART